MMISKKPGPPVPPRPSATIVANSLAKSQINPSIIPMPHGRTVIYKSPSYDINKKPNEVDAIHKITGKSNDSCYKVTAIATAKPRSTNGVNISVDDVKLSNKTEIIIVNNNLINSNNINNKNEQNVILDKKITEQTARTVFSDNNGNSCENSHKLEVKQKSPVARPRQNAPSKKMLKSNNEKIVQSMPMSQSIVVNNENAKTHQNIIEVSSINDKPIKNNNIDNQKLINDETTTKGLPEFVLNERNNARRIEIKNSNLEIKNNLRNSNGFSTVAEKLFTEIVIKSSAYAEEPKKYQTKLEHCIKVRTPSPPKIDNLNKSQTILPMQSEKENDARVKAKNEEKCLAEKKVTFHELLISELAAMHKDDIPENRRKRYPSSCSTDSSPNGTQRSRIRTSDWVEVGDNGKEVLLSSCQISLEDSGLEDEEKLDDMSSGVGDSWDSVKDVEERMSLPGLPPLPKSLSGLELTGANQHNSSGFLALDSQRGVPQIARKPSTLDTQLAILRREMFGLRQLDLSLMSQLWALNESIQEFRTIIQEQETLSPPSPSPSPSDTNSVSSGDEAESTQENHLTAMQLQQQQHQQHQQRMRSAPPPPPPNRKAPSRPV